MTHQVLTDLLWETLLHLAHSPDIASFGHNLFLSIQQSQKGKHFKNEAEVRKRVDK